MFSSFFFLLSVIGFGFGFGFGLFHFLELELDFYLVLFYFIASYYFIYQSDREKIFLIFFSVSNKAILC
jgi:hypothetical protein